MKIALIYPVIEIDPRTCSISDAGYLLAPNGKKKNSLLDLYRTRGDAIKGAKEKGFTHVRWNRIGNRTYKI